MLNCAKRALLEGAGGDRRVIIADAGFPSARAEEARPLATACGDIAAPAISAFHQAGENVRRLSFGWRRMATAPARHSLLHAPPISLLNNAQLRHIGKAQFTFGIDPGDTLAGIGILDEALSVPNQPAGIEVLP
ncbi:MAG: hypothetical protein WBF03_14925 [Xanthobacteraceae bacterium]